MKSILGKPPKIDATFTQTSFAWGKIYMENFSMYAEKFSV